MRSELKPKIAWPRQDAALRQLKEQRANVLSTFLHARANALAAEGGLPALCGCGLDARTALLDVVSPLITIASLPLRPVQLSLMSSREKREAQELVTVGVVIISILLAIATALPFHCTTSLVNVFIFLLTLVTPAISFHFPCRRWYRLA